MDIDRKKLRTGLRRHRGSINEVAERAGCGREWVRLVLKGLEKGGDEVLLVASKVLKEREEKREALLQEVNANMAGLSI